MDTVTNEAYLDMIRQKTAVLLGFSLQAGAILGGASKEDGKKLYDLGISIGLGFQLMDDYLDSFGETAKVGKRIGGDILEKKKTYLWNEMWSRLNDEEKNNVLASYSSETSAIADVKETMDSSGAKDYTLKLAQEYTDLSLNGLQHFNTSGDKSYLEEIVHMLAGRES
jgi:geranylgeranyl diphosphate synthase type II